jgi:hypothetical protein
MAQLAPNKQRYDQQIISEMLNMLRTMPITHTTDKHIEICWHTNGHSITLHSQSDDAMNYHIHAAVYKEMEVDFSNKKHQRYMCGFYRSGNDEIIGPIHPPY